MPATEISAWERLTSSIQSSGLPPLDSTSLIATGTPHALAAPLVAATVSRSSPVPSGQRPSVVAACAVHAASAMSVVRSGANRRTLSALPSPNGNPGAEPTLFCTIRNPRAGRIDPDGSS